MHQAVHDDAKSQLQTTVTAYNNRINFTVPLVHKIVQMVNEPFSTLHMHRLIINFVIL